MIVSCGKKDTIGVGAVCCRLWTCAFESAPKMAGDIAACNIKVQDLEGFTVRFVMLCEVLFENY